MALKAFREWLSDRVGAYRDLPQYLQGIKKTGIEIACGESMLALAFAIYTYVYAISLCSVLLFFGGSFVLAGYHIWRGYYLRLRPKLEFAPKVFLELNKAVTGSTVHTIAYVQVLPRCLTDASVEQCRGRLLRVLKWDADHWGPTALNEPLDLIWSFRNSEPLTLEPGVDQRLNILAVTMNNVDLQVDPRQKPIKAADVFRVDEDFRFDVNVSGKDCPTINISARIRIGRQTPVRLNERLPLPVVVGIADDASGSAN